MELSSLHMFMQFLYIIFDFREHFIKSIRMEYNFIYHRYKKCKNQDSGEKKIRTKIIYKTIFNILQKYNLILIH